MRCSFFTKLVAALFVSTLAFAAGTGPARAKAGETLVLRLGCDLVGPALTPGGTPPSGGADYRLFNTGRKRFAVCEVTPELAVGTVLQVRHRNGTGDVLLGLVTIAIDPLTGLPTAAFGIDTAAGDFVPDMRVGDNISLRTPPSGGRGGGGPVTICSGTLARIK
jgi:hypothetical protein